MNDSYRPLSFTVGEDQVSTVGLASINHPDPTMHAATLAQAEQSRAILLHLAAYVVSAGARLEPGGPWSWPTIMCYSGPAVTGCWRWSLGRRRDAAQPGRAAA